MTLHAIAVYHTATREYRRVIDTLPDGTQTVPEDAITADLADITKRRYVEVRPLYGQTGQAFLTTSRIEYARYIVVEEGRL